MSPPDAGSIAPDSSASPAPRAVPSPVSLLRRLMQALLPRNKFGDAVFASISFLYHHRRLPRWRRPVTFNDHLFAIKLRGELYDPLRQYVSDKLQVKDYIAGRVGPDYVLETLAVLESEAEVEAFRPLPQACVVKPTHLSGYFFLLGAGEMPDREEMKRWLRLNYYDLWREANYRYLRPRILVEAFFAGEAEGATPEDITQDYKVFSIGGRVKFILSVMDRFGETNRLCYSRDWKRLPFLLDYEAEGEHPRPERLEEMIAVAERVSADFSSVRVDFLAAGGRLKIGELTNVHMNAQSQFLPGDFDRRMGRLFTEPDLTVEDVL